MQMYLSVNIRRNRFKFKGGKPRCLMCTINLHAQTDLLTQLVEVNETLRNDKPLGISHSGSGKGLIFHISHSLLRTL